MVIMMMVIIKAVTSLCSVLSSTFRTVVSEETHNLFCTVNEQETKIKHRIDLAFVQM